MLTYQEENCEASVTFSDTTATEAIRNQSTGEEIDRYAVYWLECHLPDFEQRDREAYHQTLEKLAQRLDGEQTQVGFLQLFEATLHIM